MSKPFDELKSKHLNLLKRAESELIIDEIRQFIEECRKAGRDISDPDERDYVRTNILRYWRNFLYSRTNTYPDIELEPPREEIAVERPEALYHQGLEYLEGGEWDKAIETFQEISKLEPRYKDVKLLLEQARGIGEARKKLREQQKRERWRRAIAIAWGTLGVIFAITVGIFPDRFVAAVGNTAEKLWREIGAAPTPTVAISSIDSIEVWMNGAQLNLDQLPSLTSGQAVELEVVVFDTQGKRYTSDDLVCRWSVAPLGDEDEGINTELCKTFYTPSQEYSQQVVILEEVEGLEQQFEPIDPIPMTFEIE